MDFATAPLAALFFAAALLYSSVGHGGASAYLAILALAGFDREMMVPTVLVLNILVTLWGCFNYHRAGHLDLRLLRPFILASIPAAFLGGMLQVPQNVFSLILGGTLLAAGLRFLFFSKPIRAKEVRSSKVLWGVGLPVGFGLGFLAGLIGIGGGIFLSPLLLLLGWAGVKKTAAVSAGFIVLNSASGLAAHLLKSTPDYSLLGVLAAAVIVGGGLGSYAGAARLSPAVLQKLLGAVLLAASFKLLSGPYFLLRM